MLALFTALLSLVAAYPSNVARSNNPLPGYKDAPQGAICNHTVVEHAVLNSCEQATVLLDCQFQTSPPNGPYLYQCPGLPMSTPYCNTEFRPAEHKFVAACTAPFAYEIGCTETYDNDVFRYECPWDGQA